MVFNPEIKAHLIEIEKKTSSLRDLIKSGKDRNYANLLLYGEPGTGKTLFAQVLAEKTNMDFLPVTAASLLQAGVEGIKYFDEIINMANRSKYGTIIFVDEADALFIDRSTINPGSDHYKVLNHILSIVDGRSNKFMVIAATNHAYLLDPAMGRRFQDRVLMPLPDATTRTALLNLYIPQILFNVKQTNQQFVKVAQALLTPELIAHISERTAGLSHSEIADMIEAMRDKAELDKRSLLVQDIQSAIDAAIDKHQKKTEDKKIREQWTEKNN
jgi:ATPase family AAA domain-containing protein 3A/B